MDSLPRWHHLAGHSQNKAVAAGKASDSDVAETGLELAVDMVIPQRERVTESST